MQSPWAPRPGTIPLLTKTTGRPRDFPSTTVRGYGPTAPAVPAEGGVRKVPILETGNGIPFLRLGKPQSQVLSRVVLQKGMRLQKQVSKRKELVEEELVAARWEDQWDQLMSDLGIREDDEGPGRARFADPVQTSISTVQAWLNADREDRVARAKAMWRIVEQERAGREAREEG